MIRKAGIIAAFPSELKPLVQGWSRTDLPRGDTVWQGRIGAIEPVDCAAVAGGMGRKSAERACQIANSLMGGLDILISVGFAGSLSCGLEAGAAYPVAQVIDRETGERFSTVHDSPPVLILVTIDHIASSEEKRKLRDGYQAVLVDMEAAAVGKFAKANAIDFFCVKAISDEIDDAMPDFANYGTSDGKLQNVRLAGYLMVRPRYWPLLVKMGKNGKVGAAAIARLTVEFFEKCKQ